MRCSLGVIFLLASFFTLVLLAGNFQNQPAPNVDRVGFPKGYRDKYHLLRSDDRADKKQVVTIYANDPAASVESPAQLPYPYGAIIVMETSSALKDSQGKIVLDEKGHYRKDKVLGLHVMRKERGFGDVYQQNRTGEWEYVEYRADESYITPPQKSFVCAQCHLKAGRDKDFVFGGRDHSDNGK